MRAADVETIEIDLLLEAMHRRYGYDFRHYARASLRRRILEMVSKLGYRTIAEVIPSLVHDNSLAFRVISFLSVPVTEMFRDPESFLVIRQKVIPVLRSFPRINAWQAGCATGEEAYSLAILLKEEGVLDRSQIYATDINDAALAKAEEGVFPLRQMEEYSSNYRRAGGKAALSDYYHAAYDFAHIERYLNEKIVFAHHNLVSDGVFCEVNLIMCRNVLIYFDRVLQSRVLRLFGDSLERSGFLCLGVKESPQFPDKGEGFKAIDSENRIFQRTVLHKSEP